MQSFIDKHVLITGGAEGVGKGFVEEFIKLGATVSIMDIQTEKGMQICKEFNGKCYFFQCDVSSCEMLRETYESIKREVGTIDILINNAAVAVRKPLKEISE